jgi:hypothetical protein
LEASGIRHEGDLACLGDEIVFRELNVNPICKAKLRRLVSTLVTVSGLRDLAMVPGTPTGLGHNDKLEEEPEAEHTQGTHELGTHELEGLPSPLTSLRKRYAHASLDNRNNHAQLVQKKAHADQKEAARVLEV